MSTLREPIGALDRRVPHVDRPGEIRIVRDAQMRRRQAVAQIKALNRQEPDDKPYDQELADAIMTDDGCPLCRGLPLLSVRDNLERAETYVEMTSVHGGRGQ